MEATDKASILIVEDDADINNMLCDLLTVSGYSTTTSYSGTEAVMLLERQSFDLILLDLMLPGMSGEQVIEQARREIKTPIIAVSAKDDKQTKVGVLRDGADDYITKPFDTDELIARIEALLRRSKASATGSRDRLRYKDVQIDRTTMEVTASGVPVTLTKREFLILELLMSNPKKVFSKNSIFEAVWNEPFLGEDNSINVHISNIRNKLARVNPEEKYIQTVWGIGFRLY